MIVFHTMNESMHELATRLFPICRSITGNGVRATLKILQEHLPNLQINEVPTGTQCFDWQVPEEWNITEATLTGPDGEVIADFKVNNLHVVGYSTPVDEILELDDLQVHLHSIPAQPNAIPYVTSYYQRTWGFCLTHNIREKLKPGSYHAQIKSTLMSGSLSYGELLIPGETKEEVLISTYVCHPSMANNELSGPVVSTFLAKYLEEQTEPLRLSYRFVFIPETIGSIVYLSRHLEYLRQHVIAGFVVTCVGDDLAYSYLASRKGNTLADRVAKHVLGALHPDYVSYSYLRRGSDERNYCWPGVDLPVCSIMRTRYGCFPQYHTSLDNLEFISEAGLRGTLDVLIHCMECLELCETLRTTSLGEPQMGRRNLYPTTSGKGHAINARVLVDALAYCDGNEDLLAIAEALGQPLWTLADSIRVLRREGLLEAVVS